MPFHELVAEHVERGNCPPVPAVISTDSSPVQLMPAPVFLKSKRWESSFLRLVEGVVGPCRSTLLTMSKLLPCHVSHPTSRHVSCYRTFGGLPEGQRNGLKTVGVRLRWFEPSTRHHARLVRALDRRDPVSRHLCTPGGCPLAQSAERLHGMRRSTVRFRKGLTGALGREAE